MEEGKSMGGSGEGGGNCGGRRLGLPPAATTAAAAGQGSGSGRPGDAEGGVARRRAWAPSRRLAGETTKGPTSFFYPLFFIFYAHTFFLLFREKVSPIYFFY